MEHEVILGIVNEHHHWTLVVKKNCIYNIHQISFIRQMHGMQIILTLELLHVILHIILL